MKIWRYIVYICTAFMIMINVLLFLQCHKYLILILHCLDVCTHIRTLVERAEAHKGAYIAIELVLQT